MVCESSGPFRLVQVADFHLYAGPLAWWDLATKRFYGGLAWYRRRKEFHFGILDALAVTLKALRPDLVAVAGDLTHLGRLAEFRRARELLAELGPPERVVAIPGNHDAYVSGAWEAGRKLLAPWLVPAGAADGSAPYPGLLLRGEIAMITLNSVYPRPWYLADGRLGPGQRERLARMLEEQGRRGRARVILIHHPPLPEQAGRRRRLADGAELVRIIEDCGAELILHGHLHRQSLCRFVAAGGKVVPVCGVPAASALGRTPERRARFNLCEIGRAAAGGWRISVTTHRWSRRRKAFVREQNTGAE